MLHTQFEKQQQQQQKNMILFFIHLMSSIFFPCAFYPLPAFNRFYTPPTRTFIKLSRYILFSVCFMVVHMRELYCMEVKVLKNTIIVRTIQI